MGRLPVAMACLLSTLLLAEMSGTAKAAVVSTVPVFPMIPSNQGSKDFQVLVSVEAPEGPRLPIHLVVVHSISDDDLLAKTSKAMVFISKQLQLVEEMDHLTIVGPADDEDEGPVVDSVESPNEAKEKMKMHSKAHAESTSLETSLHEATTILNGWTAPERAGAIIVLTDRSDGLSSEVVNYLFKGSESDYPVHIFGLGTKHDPMALHGLASASTGGTYSFIDDDNLGHITAALAVCMGGLKNVVFPGTSVLKLEAAAGVTLKGILYGSQGRTATGSAEEIKIKIGALHARETWKIVVYLDVQAEGDEPRHRHDGGCGGKTLLTASFFRDYDDDVPAHKGAVCVQRPPRLPAVVQVGAPSPIVLQQIVRMKLLQMIIRISGSVDLVNELVSEWSTFVQSHQYWSGVDAFLGVLQEEIDAMVAYASSHSSSLAVYHVVNSWISSHETQRPTAMGSPNNVVVQFLREEVKIMIQVEIQQQINVHVDCPERNCFDANELAQLILVAMKEKRLRGKPCREIDGVELP
ncbi:unnamed protein product [Urochloa humidicola]